MENKRPPDREFLLMASFRLSGHKVRDYKEMAKEVFDLAEALQVEGDARYDIEETRSGSRKPKEE